MIRLFFIVPIFLFLLSCSGSVMEKQSDSGKYTIILSHKGKELKKGRNSVKLRIVDSKGVRVEGAVVELSPWMPDMGHGVMLIPEVTDLKNGDYRIENIFFSMEGLWELRIKILKGNLEESAIFEFPDIT